MNPQSRPDPRRTSSPSTVAADAPSARGSGHALARQAAALPPPAEDLTLPPLSQILAHYRRHGTLAARLARGLARGQGSTGIQADDSREWPVSAPQSLPDLLPSFDERAGD